MNYGKEFQNVSEDHPISSLFDSLRIAGKVNSGRNISNAYDEFLKYCRSMKGEKKRLEERYITDGKYKIVLAFGGKTADSGWLETLIEAKNCAAENWLSKHREDNDLSV